MSDGIRTSRVTMVHEWNSAVVGGIRDVVSVEFPHIVLTVIPRPAISEYMEELTQRKVLHGGIYFLLRSPARAAFIGKRDFFPFDVAEAEEALSGWDIAAALDLPSTYRNYGEVLASIFADRATKCGRFKLLNSIGRREATGVVKSGCEMFAEVVSHLFLAVGFEVFEHANVWQPSDRAADH